MEVIKQSKFSGYILAALLAIIPFIHLKSLADPTLLSRQLYFGLVSGVSCIILLFNYKNLKFQLAPLFLSFSALWFLSSLLSLSYAHNLPEAAYSLSKTALYVSGIWVFAGMFQSGLIRMKEISYGVIICSSIALGFLVNELIQNVTVGVHLWDKKNLYNLTTQFGHKNLYSSFQLLCIPFIIYTIIYSGNLWRIALAFLLALVLFSIGLIQTKSVILGIMAAIFIGIPLSAKLLFNKNNNFIWYLSGLYLLIILGGIFVVYSYPQKFTLLLNNDTIRERILLWHNTWQMIQESFPLGKGAGNWQVFFPKYGLGEFMKTNYLVSDGYTTFQRPHSDFLWVLSELGLAGIIGYAGMFIVLILKSIKRIRTDKTNKEKSVLLIFLLCVIAYIFVALVDFPLERNEHQLLLGLIIAFLLGNNIEPKKEQNKNHKAILIPAAIMICGSLSFTFLRLPNEQYSKKIVQAHMSGNWEMILSQSKKINSGIYTLDNFSIPIAWYKGLAYYSLNNKPEAKKCFTEAYVINPFQVHVLNNMAGMFEEEGKHEEALKYYNDLLNISPAQPDAILNKSAVLFNQQKYAEAMECIYQFNYDEGNIQFLQYLQAIGKSYLQQLGNKKTATQKEIRLNKIDEPEYIKSFFKWNKEQKHSFAKLDFPAVKKQQ